MGFYMVIDDKLLEKLEKLSYLEIEESKREGIERELTQILNFVENLNGVDTDGLPDKFVMRDIEAHLREDTPVRGAEVSDSILKNSPQSEDNFFVVPKIIE
jgi:aspartyl-tRNA(Asn)/glutamyl-tRNA(Gln) amidotransferase subunit C